MDSLKQQLDFILELDRLKGVYRQTTIKGDKNRQENSAEHSWHIALMAQILQEYAEESINVARVTYMLLIHDVVEIDAGDTFAFAEQHLLDSQEDKEIDAAKRIFGMLPSKQYQHTLKLWLEFEQAETVDAKFAKAMDRILPVFQNMQNQGGSWAKHGVKKAQVLKRNDYLKSAAPKLWLYVQQQVTLAVENGWLIND